MNRSILPSRRCQESLASRLSEKRSVASAAGAFRESIQSAHENKPERIFTDAHNSYKGEIEIAFGQGPRISQRQGWASPREE